MNKPQIEALELLDIKLSAKQIKTFDKYMQIFLEKNARLNLISKNDEKLLFEKHIFDSLAINKFLKPKKSQTLLDIGTGGGFPSVPVAILYSDLNVYAIDSIRKKINAIDEIKQELNLKNLFPICERVETLAKKQSFDYITTRAVSKLNVTVKYAAPILKKGGYFIAYKSKTAEDEIKEAQSLIKKAGMELIDVIEYTLPLSEIYKRNLIVLQKK